MSEETGQTVEEKKGREAAEEASALDKLTDKVNARLPFLNQMGRISCSLLCTQYCHLMVCNSKYGR